MTAKLQHAYRFPSFALQTTDFDASSSVFQQRGQSAQDPKLETVFSLTSGSAVPWSSFAKMWQKSTVALVQIPRRLLTSGFAHRPSREHFPRPKVHAISTQFVTMTLNITEQLLTFRQEVVSLYFGHPNQTWHGLHLSRSLRTTKRVYPQPRSTQLSKLISTATKHLLT